MPALEGPNGHLTLQFLTWLSETPRIYGEAMDAWRTSCPRLSIWEDALRDGLIEIEPGHGSMRGAMVMLTETGKELLLQQRRSTGGARHANALAKNRN